MSDLVAFQGLAPNALTFQFPCLHSIGQRVFMMVDDGRAYRKKYFLVKDVQPHRHPKEPAYWEYQLASKEGAVYMKGKYFREKDVKRA